MLYVYLAVTVLSTSFSKSLLEGLFAESFLSFEGVKKMVEVISCFWLLSVAFGKIILPKFAEFSYLIPIAPYITYHILL